jgi:site-specific recombinase XerD
MDALLAAVDRSTWIGRRDHVLLAVALRTGLRLSELTGLRCQDVELGTGAHLKCMGKGRKRRDTPLDKSTVKLLRAWMHEQGGNPENPLFPSRRGSRLSPDAVQRLVAKHVATAQSTCPSLMAKRITTHNLRHSCAMDLLSNGLDIAVLAMWLGHEKLESVNAYVHADLTLKERALARRTPLKGRAGRYRPNDALLAFLEAL